MAITAWCAKFCHQLDLLVGERPNLLAIDVESANHLAVFEQWDGQQRTGTSEIDESNHRRIAPDVTWLSLEVSDVDGLPGRDQAAKGLLRTRADQRVPAAIVGKCRRRIVKGNHLKCVTDISQQVTELRLADTRRILQHGVEYRLQFAG